MNTLLAREHGAHLAYTRDHKKTDGPRSAGNATEGLTTTYPSTAEGAASMKPRVLAPTPTSHCLTPFGVVR